MNNANHYQQKIEAMENEKQQQNETNEEEAIRTQIQELLNICPFDNEQQRKEFEYIINIHNSSNTIVSTATTTTTKGFRPTQDQINEIKKQRKIKKKIWSEVSDEVRCMLERIIVLNKKMLKVAAKSSM